MGFGFEAWVEGLAGLDGTEADKRRTRDGQGTDKRRTRDGQETDQRRTREGHETDRRRTRDGQEIDKEQIRAFGWGNLKAKGQLKVRFW